ncbi:hypothetical protein SAMD00019534_081110, partial [Acytostelium subglobosum LB1]|uniref:hypothetical protein n=1 Tax=Acytostelium subglobosum LB1 TaxID=1410327 RepID=UPI000644B258
MISINDPLCGPCQSQCSPSVSQSRPPCSHIAMNLCLHLDRLPSYFHVDHEPLSPSMLLGCPMPSCPQPRTSVSNLTDCRRAPTLTTATNLYLHLYSRPPCCQVVQNLCLC